MRLTLCVSDHAVSIRGVPKGISGEVLAEYLRVMRVELMTIYTGDATITTEITE